MSPKDAVVRNKTNLQDILSADYTFILDKVYAKNLITDRDYKNLKSINKGNVGDHVTELVDKIIFKGIETDFVDLLLDKDVLNNFPRLKNLDLGDTGSTVASSRLKRSADLSQDAPPESKLQKSDDTYPLSSKPTGLCVIINNENFQAQGLKPPTKRSGTEKDLASLANVFNWLGFQVLMCKDQTKSDMAQVTKHLAALEDLAELQKCKLEEWSDGKFTPLSMLPRHGDAFVCCLLSHGDKGVVLGVDHKPLPIEDITSAFDGQHCSGLLEKPKVFFIQACQGNGLQPGVALDYCAPEEEEEEEEDSPPVVFIPVDADFLVAMATVEKYKALRVIASGSWFIQSLCAQLRKGCPRGDDIMQILYHVNNDVSQKIHIGHCGVVKQMPEAKKVTLRRRLVFSPCSS